MNVKMLPFKKYIKLVLVLLLVNTFCYELFIFITKTRPSMGYFSLLIIAISILICNYFVAREELL